MSRSLRAFAKRLLPRALCISRLRRTSAKTILLTFDDGPHPEATPAVLERLERFNAKAVFFVVGSRIHRAPTMLQRIVDQGHWIGNHSYEHPLERRMNAREYSADLIQCNDLIRDACGVRPILHRPPLGSLRYSTVVVPMQLALQTMIWSLSTEDWRLTADVDAAKRAIDVAAATRHRDILLLHDEKMHTPALLDGLLPRLQDRGFSLAPGESLFAC